MLGPPMAPAEDSHLRHLRHLLQLQVFKKKTTCPLKISKDRQRPAAITVAADGQAVEPVREVHGIAGSHQHQLTNKTNGYKASHHTCG